MTEKNAFWSELSSAVFGESTQSYAAHGTGHLPSYYKTSDFAEATIGLAGTSLARLCGGQGGDVAVDRRLASLWFDMTLRPLGWEASSLWDPIAGDYPCRDGWIRLHTNARHHRDAALSVLHVPVDRAAVAQAVAAWDGEALETAIVAANGCAAFMRTPEEWHAHPQGRALASEPLVHWFDHGEAAAIAMPDATSLKGIKVLDLTRVLAGPVATRFLAGFGATVLRIDPPFWNEPSVEMEVTLGKRCAGLDLALEADRLRLKELITEADVLVHGYRADALERLGLGDTERRILNPNLVDVSLNAYGWCGAWRNRRGFDSLVQMSCGIASLGMSEAGSDLPMSVPVPLPVQALDHGTGYLVAACVLEALKQRSEGRIHSAKLSLARTAYTLMQQRCEFEKTGAIIQGPEDFSKQIENTGWGPAHRVQTPITVMGHVPEWSISAGPLRRH